MSKTFFNIRESNTTEEVVEEVVELEELTAAEKKMINQMYDKKGNLTAIGKKVMDHGKREAGKLSPKDLDKDAARRKEYKAFQKSKRNESLDEDVTMSMGWKSTDKSFEQLMKALRPGSNITKTINLTVKVDKTMKKIEKHLGQAYSMWQDIEQQIGMQNEGIDEATIPQGKTAFTKKDMPNKKDMSKLQKIRKMLDKEKGSKKEEVDVNEALELTEAMGNWTISVVKPVNKLKKGQNVTVKARSAFEAINKAMKHWKDPALKAVPSSHFKIVKEEVGVEEAKKSAGKKLTPDQIRKALSSTKAKAKGKEKVSLKKAPWDK